MSELLPVHCILMIPSSNFFRDISNEYTGKITQLSLNAFGFVNNTCTCSNFGFLPKPEWSDKLGQPYCRCDTRNRIFKQITRQNPRKELN